MAFESYRPTEMVFDAPADGVFFVAQSDFPGSVVLGHGGDFGRSGIGPRHQLIEPGVGVNHVGTYKWCGSTLSGLQVSISEAMTPAGAAGMIRRAERIVRDATAGGAAGTADRLNWAGTFMRSAPGCCALTRMISASIRF